MKKNPEKYMSVDFSKVFRIFEKIESDKVFLELLRVLKKFSLERKTTKFKKKFKLKADFDKTVLARMLYQQSHSLKGQKEFKSLANSLINYLNKWFLKNKVDEVWKDKKVFSLEIC